MKLAVLMDPIETLNPIHDTTLAMLLAAQQLGWSCSYFTQDDLYCLGGCVGARVCSVQLGDLNSQRWFNVLETKEERLSSFDIILMRRDPPFDLEYIYATYLLDLVEKEGVLVVNKPQSLRDANEKMVTLHVPQCCPPTLVSRDINRLRAFWEVHQQVIYKPLAAMGGNSVFYVNESGINLSVILEVLTKNETVTIMAQQYIPDIKATGDKRILLINGEPVPYALARIPAKGDLRGNIAAGASGKVVAITRRDRWICEQIKPMLRAKGLYFVGIDVIGDYLTEINVTSPTCLQEIARETGLSIAEDYLHCLESITSN